MKEGREFADKSKNNLKKQTLSRIRKNIEQDVRDLKYGRTSKQEIYKKTEKYLKGL